MNGEDSQGGKPAGFNHLSLKEQLQKKMTQLKAVPKQEDRSFMSQFAMELKDKLGKLKPVPKTEPYEDPNIASFKAELAFRAVNLKAVPKNALRHT